MSEYWTVVEGETKQKESVVLKRQQNYSSVFYESRKATDLEKEGIKEKDKKKITKKKKKEKKRKKLKRRYRILPCLVYQYLYLFFYKLPGKL